MSEKVLKITGIIIILAALGALYLAYTGPHIIFFFVALFGMLYGAYIFLTLWINKPLKKEPDAYELAMAKQRSELKAQELRKKIKIVKNKLPEHK